MLGLPVEGVEVVAGRFGSPVSVPLLVAVFEPVIVAVSVAVVGRGSLGCDYASAYAVQVGAALIGGHLPYFGGAGKVIK